GALDAETNAEANLKEARENLTLAKKAVNETFDVARNHPLLQQPGMHPVRKLLLEKALPFYKRLSQQTGNDPAARAELADQHFRVGAITAEIGNKTEARKAYRQAENIFRSLGEGDPASTEYQTELARTLINLGAVLQEEGRRSAALANYKQARDIFQKRVKAN